jgi:hypothetical protein
MENQYVWSRRNDDEMQNASGAEIVTSTVTAAVI